MAFDPNVNLGPPHVPKRCGSWPSPAMVGPNRCSTCRRFGKRVSSHHLLELDRLSDPQGTSGQIIWSYATACFTRRSLRVRRTGAGLTATGKHRGSDG